MGRDSSEATAPSNVRRAERARFAKETIHKTVPAILHSNPRARRGIESAHLLVDLPRINPGGSKKKDKNVVTATTTAAAATTTGIRIRIVDEDTLTAVSLFRLTGPPTTTTKSTPPKTAVLSMASPLRPGGGVFTGSQSQEESLCVRTTLYWSLKEDYYRLPPLGCVYTPDVLVFRDEDNKDLAKKDRFFVDIISCAALRFPEVEDGRFENSGDREQMWEKMRVVMRAAAKGGVTNVVLGAWGCGAYGNPVEEVAEGWKKVLVGGGKGGRGKIEAWNGIEEVVFAISTKTAEGKHQLEVFQKIFEGVAFEEKEPQVEAGAAGNDDLDDDEELRLRDIQDLTEEIKLKESQLDRIKNDSLRQRISEIIVSLKKELEVKSHPNERQDHEDEDDGGGPKDIDGGSSSKDKV